MFDAPILGIDPGVARVGVAVVVRVERRPTILWSGTVTTPTDLGESKRLLAVASAVRDVIDRHRPKIVALERLAWNVNRRSAMSVARSTGAVMVVAAEAGLPVEEYGSLEVKKAVTGSGGASKAQVRHALERIHGLGRPHGGPDAADAVAVALTHLSTEGVSSAATRAGRR